MSTEENQTLQTSESTENYQEDTSKKMETQVQGAPMAVVVDGQSENFVNKVSSLPMVASTMSQMSSMYNWTKESNGMIKYTLETAEKTVAVAASTAKPVVDRLEKPSKFSEFSLFCFLNAKPIKKFRTFLRVTLEGIGYNFYESHLEGKG